MAHGKVEPSKLDQVFLGCLLSRPEVDDEFAGAALWSSTSFGNLSASAALMPLKVLDVALVLFGRGAGVEGAKISSLAGFGVGLAGVEAEFAGF